jgi:hypothetical protein
MASETELALRLRQEFPAEVAQAEIASAVANSLGHAPPRIRYTVVLVGHVEDLDPVKLKALVEQLRNYTCDSELTIEAIRKGSVILVCEGTESGFAKLFEDFSIGKLTSLMGFPLSDVVLNVAGVSIQAADALDPQRTMVLGPMPRFGGLPEAKRSRRPMQTTSTLRAPPLLPLPAAVPGSPEAPGTLARRGMSAAASLGATAPSAAWLGDDSVAALGPPGKPIPRKPLRRLFAFGALGAGLCGLVLTLLSLNSVQHAPGRPWDMPGEDPQGTGQRLAVGVPPSIPSEARPSSESRPSMEYGEPAAAGSPEPQPSRSAPSPNPSWASSSPRRRPAARTPEFRIDGVDDAAKNAVLTCAVAHIRPYLLPAGSVLTFEQIGSRWLLYPGSSAVPSSDLRDGMDFCLQSELSKLGPKHQPKSMRIRVLRNPG